MQVKTLLTHLDLGSSVAEFDESLNEYFVETESFRSLALDKVDLISGEKGTGKSALYRIFSRRYTKIPQMQNVEVVPGFNPAGNPVFQKLARIDPLDEGQYVTVWKSYFLSLVGNWLLELYTPTLTDRMLELDALLVKVGLRSTDDSAETVFSRLINVFGRWLRPKSAQVAFSLSETGIPVMAPKLEFDQPAPQADPVDFVAHEAALSHLNKTLAEVNLTVWVVLDRLDEAFQGFPAVEVPVLRALLRTYLDLLAYPRIRLKLFVRNDLFRKVIHGGFVNLTHVNARKTEIVWEEEDLLNLLCSRVRKSTELVSALNLAGKTDTEVFNCLFPEQVDQGDRRPTTWRWIMSRIQDGNAIKPPRNLIDLIVKAKDAQIRAEDRNSREYAQGVAIIISDSIKRAQRALSDQRVQDTLLAEAADMVPIIERFRDGKAEHNISSLTAILQTNEAGVRNAVRPLLEMGFLEEVGDSFKVPMLYRDGLQITQGKAFTTDSFADDDEA